MEKLPIVFLDIETTGFSQKHDNIIQIAAKCNNQEFNEYILPNNKKMHPKSIKTTGITINHGRMFVRNHEVYTISIDEAINKFIHFLNNLSNFKVLLIAHNGHPFDFKFLVRDGYRDNFDIALKCNIFGFVDTLKLIKDTISRQSYSLENLAAEFIPNYNSDNAHNAIHDVRNLRKVIRNMGFKHDDFAKSCMEFSEYEDKSNIKNIINHY